MITSFPTASFRWQEYVWGVSDRQIRAPPNMMQQLREASQEELYVISYLSIQQTNVRREKTPSNKQVFFLLEFKFQNSVRIGEGARREFDGYSGKTKEMKVKEDDRFHCEGGSAGKWSRSVGSTLARWSGERGISLSCVMLLTTPHWIHPLLEGRQFYSRLVSSSPLPQHSQEIC
ncbi:hypothetical protein NPIL_92421 [Nephila pilipes]|uniref:Uncharacterized protein n=1 Tax=Nephila pilipes TaxID=299642 RepID=A0A8X6P800_NEPPI|nr:hypothetical protein NPIL_92421 [Nephila pilipes]